VAVVLRVGFSDLIPEERLAALVQIFGEIQILETVTTSNSKYIVERARAIMADVIVFDVGRAVASIVGEQLSNVQILCPLRRKEEFKREYREGVFVETRETFAEYGRLNEQNEIEPFF